MHMQITGEFRLILYSAIASPFGWSLVSVRI